VGSNDGNAYALNATTGAFIWSYKTGNGVFSSPAVAGGVVYVGSNDNKVYAFGPVHDVAVTNVTTCKDGCTPFSTVGQNWTMHINVTVENQGDYTEDFNITVYANTTMINQTQLELPSTTTTVLTIKWNATLPYGNYTISAVADAVGNETDIEDNTHVGSTVLVTIPGDVTTPGLYVQYLDLGRVIGTAYGKKLGQQYYDPNADFNDDHYTQYLDLGILLAHYGQHYP
jgi:outer membrane protein assembly factor BamB